VACDGRSKANAASSQERFAAYVRYYT
jgi:hypothetical protein